MSNPNNPFGFDLSKNEGKAARVRYYDKGANAIYPGDVLTLIAAGKADVSAAGDKVLGVAAEYKSAASTDKVAVYDDPEEEFIVQVSAGYVDPTDVGQNANIVATAGDSTLKESNHAIDSTTFAVTATLQFKIMGLYVHGDNASGTNAIIRVKPNNHFFNAGVAGI